MSTSGFSVTVCSLTVLLGPLQPEGAETNHWVLELRNHGIPSAEDTGALTKRTHALVARPASAEAGQDNHGLTALDWPVWLAEKQATFSAWLLNWCKEAKQALHRLYNLFTAANIDQKDFTKSHLPRAPPPP